MVAEGRLEEIAMAEGADWHFAVGELNKAQITALSAAERVLREKAEALEHRLREQQAEQERMMAAKEKRLRDNRFGWGRGNVQPSCAC